MQGTNIYQRNILELVARGGASGGAPEDETPAPAPANDESTALKAQLGKEIAAREKLEADAKKRADDDRKILEAKAIDDGKAKDLLAAEQKRREDLEARLAGVEASQKEEAKAIFAKLPKAEQESAAQLEAQLSVDGYLRYLKTRAGGTIVATPLPALAPGVRGAGVGPENGERKISPDARELLDDNNARDSAYAITTHLKEVKLGGTEVKFTMDPKAFLNGLRRRAAMPRDLTTENVSKMFARNR